METAVHIKLTSQHIESFKKVVGESYVVGDEESLQHYSHDETETLSFSFLYLPAGTWSQ